MRERRQRLHHRALAHVGGAEIRLESPDRENDLRRHARALLDAGEQRRVLLQPLLRARDAPGGDARAHIFLEAFAERAALAVIEIDDFLIARDAIERAVDDGLRDAARLRFPRHRVQERVEIAAALRGEYGGGERKRERSGCE